MYVMYPISVDVDIVKLRSLAYGTLGVLRGLPFKCDQNAGTAACVNAIKNMLDHNFPRPGRYAVLLHCLFHRVVIQVTGRQRKFARPVDPSVSNTVSKMEMVAEVIFLGAQATEGQSTHSAVFTKAVEHVFNGARRGLVRDDNAQPLLIIADGFPLELFDSIDHCPNQPRRLPNFEAPSVTVLSDIPEYHLASYLLKVLARSSAYFRYLQHV